LRSNSSQSSQARPNARTSATPSRATMAKAQGVSKATVNRIWQSHQIKPHRTKGFKLSRDPNFLQKLTDVVGLYLNPPEKALAVTMQLKKGHRSGTDWWQMKTTQSSVTRPVHQTVAGNIKFQSAGQSIQIGFTDQQLSPHAGTATFWTFLRRVAGSDCWRAVCLIPCPSRTTR